MKKLLTFAFLLITATTFGQSKPDKWIKFEGYWYKQIPESNTGHPNYKNWRIQPIKMGSGLKLAPNGNIYATETKKLKKHHDGRWFEVIRDPWILLSLPPQQNVDTIFYELKETGRKSGRITLNK